MLKQFSGDGGDSTVGDGFYVAELMRREYPEEFNLLAKYNTYYYTKGTDRSAGDKDDYCFEYYRINRTRMIE